MTLLLTAHDVSELLTMDACIDAVEEAFRAHGEGRLHPPGLVSEHAASGAFHIKTATVGRYFAAKANANFPGRQPTIQGLVLLFDVEDGSVLAVMDSIELTARRTAAATAVAARYLAPKGPADVTIFGCGKQGRAQLEAIRRVVDVRRVFAVDPIAEAAAALGEPSTKEAARESDIVITCTTSRTPFLGVADVKRGAFIAAVGADNPQKSELAPELLAAAAVVTDVTEQAATIGDLHHALAAGAVTRDHVRGELGEVVAGRRRGRVADDEIVIFDSTGAGFQDTAAAAIVYERARERGAGTELRFA